MNKNKKYNVIVIAILLILITIFIFLNINKKTISEVKKESNLITEELPTTESNITTRAESIPVKEVQKNENIKNVLVTLNVFDKNYSIKIEEGINVYGAMKSIGDSSFSFKAKEHPGLGYFVEEINGVKGTPGKYWIYYVNGKEASVGVSKYIPKSGDIISWKQE